MMSISSLLLNFDDLTDAETKPFYSLIVAQGAQVLIDVTIPLNLFLPFLFTHNYMTKTYDPNNTYFPNEGWFSLST